MASEYTNMRNIIFLIFQGLLVHGFLLVLISLLLRRHTHIKKIATVRGCVRSNKENFSKNIFLSHNRAFHTSYEFIFAQNYKHEV